MPETQRKRGRGKPFVTGETDKLPDIMGPILPPLDQENKNPGAINGTVAKRSGLEVQGWGVSTQNVSLLKALKMNLPAWRSGWRLKRYQVHS